MTVARVGGLGSTLDFIFFPAGDPGRRLVPQWKEHYWLEIYLLRLIVIHKQELFISVSPFCSGTCSFDIHSLHSPQAAEQPLHLGIPAQC